MMNKKKKIQALFFPPSPGRLVHTQLSINLNINYKKKDQLIKKNIFFFTWSTRCWSSGVASAPRSRGAMVSKSCSLRLSTSLVLKKPAKNETLFLHFPESEMGSMVSVLLNFGCEIKKRPFLGKIMAESGA